MRIRTVFVSILLGALVACSTPGTRSDLLETTLQSYAATIRWVGTGLRLPH